MSHRRWRGLTEAAGMRPSGSRIAATSSTSAPQVTVLRYKLTLRSSAKRASQSEGKGPAFVPGTTSPGLSSSYRPALSA